MHDAFRDVEVRIRGASRADDPSARQVEARVEDSGRWEGESRFQPDQLDASDPVAYGQALGGQLANPAFVRALDCAGLTRGRPIRFRLSLDEASDLHWVRWERLSLRIGGADLRLAVHDRVAFSRYIAVEQPDGEPPDVPVFRLLFAIANPCGLADKAIDVATEIDSFLRAFEDGPVDRRLRVSVLPGRTPISSALADRIAKLGWDVVPGCATLQDIGALLVDGRHGLHVLAHGDFDSQAGVGQLLLEDRDGGKNWVKDRQLESWLGPQLQLVLFHACRGAASPREHTAPFVGLAPRLVKMGLPAAVAMQDELEVEDGRRFFWAFYRALLDEGLVDVAVNCGRKQLIAPDAYSDAWSNPVLFTRLRGGRLWRPDPLRRSVSDALSALPVDAAPPQPLEAIEHTRGVGHYDPLQGAAGPRYDLWNRCQEIAGSAGQFLVLTGPSGSLRLAQLRSVFRHFALQFLEGRSAAVPVLLELTELAGGDSTALPLMQRLWRGETTPADQTQIEGRRFLFLADGQDAMSGLAREAALTSLGRLKAIEGSSVVLLADETLIPHLVRDFQSSVLLVAQPLEWSRVAGYLAAFDTDWARTLGDEIPSRGCVDLAAHPRFLQHMVDLASSKVPLPSRGAVLRRITDIYLARASRVPRSVVDDAARRIAWTIQQGRGTRLRGADFYRLLSESRGERDFPLSDLSHALVVECRLLVSSGDEGVRFAYPLLQAYFAARHLADPPQSRRLVDDITATFGRLSRLRRWEQVFIALASMVRSPAALLEAIVAGSSLMEGEQLFLAARCYQEAVAENPACEGLTRIVEQMVDTLVWRSSWDPGRPYADRRMALDSLIAAVTAHVRARSRPPSPRAAPPIGRPEPVTPEWEAQVVAHLLSLACDPVERPARGQPEKFDWSGIRRVAAAGLLRLPEQVTAYLERTRRDLLEPLRAWWTLRGDADAMKSILLQDSPRVSPVAAFALAQTGRADDRKTLLDAYDQLRDEEVLWAIATSFESLDAAAIHAEILARWTAPREETDKSRELRRAHVCYLVQKSRLAPDALRQQLLEWLLSGTPDLQGRVLRALSKLQDAETENWVRQICEDILLGAAGKVDASKMNVTRASLRDPRLRRAAVETLRDIGSMASMRVVRVAGNTFSARKDSSEMRQLRFQVAEELYWRLIARSDTGAPRADKG